MRPFVENQNLAAYFDVILTSQDAGYLKPSPKIFQLMLKRLDVQPHEAIFIDDRQENVDGGEAAGIPSILYENNAQPKTELEVIASRP